VLAVEWPDRWTHTPVHAWHVAIADDGGDERTIVQVRTYSTR